MLALADEKQKEWKAKVNTPFIGHTPKGRERVNALIMIEALENAQKVNTLTDDQTQQLAEHYASVGRYDLAAEISKENRAHYLAYWQAVWLDDSEWCDHEEAHKYIKDNVYSIRDNREKPLLACNIRGRLNVADAPQPLIDAQRKRAEIRNAVKGYTPEQVKQYLTNRR